MLPDNKTVWDLDGTILLSCFNDPCWNEAVKLVKKPDELTRFATFHPGINRADIQMILTARHLQTMSYPTWTQLRDHDLLHTRTILNPNLDDHTSAQFARFKINWCNQHWPDYYVDDDPVICNLMQPHLMHTRCVTVEEWYQIHNPPSPPGFPWAPSSPLNPVEGANRKVRDLAAALLRCQINPKVPT